MQPQKNVLVYFLRQIKLKAMKYLSILLILSTIFLTNSCEFLYPCLEGNGVLTTQERSVTGFSSISSSSSFDVVVQKSSSTYISVEADENLQQYILTYVQDGELFLETEKGRCLDSKSRILVTVYCPDITSFVLSGSGDAQMFDFSTSNFNLVLSGSGDIDISNFTISNNLGVNLTGSGDIFVEGTTGSTDFNLSGSGDIKGDMMKSLISDIVLSGSGDIYTYASERLKVILSGSGDVYYYGNPATVDKRITGSGDVIKR